VFEPTAPTAPTAGPALTAETLGVFGTNCVILGDRSRGEAVIVDPAQGSDEAVPVLLAALGLHPVAILLTHGHFDHLWTAPVLAREHGVPVHLHPDDRWLWDSPSAAFGPGGDEFVAGFGFGPWDTSGVDLVPLVDGQRLRLAGLDLSVHHTPGHTPGHVTFATDDLAGCRVELGSELLAAPGRVLLSGDLLFAGSIGRTDQVGGDPERIVRSLAETLDRNDDATLVIPGHGPATTIGIERATNPYIERR
jgi:hydroxyacylglutathione hydrolase